MRIHWVRLGAAGVILAGALPALGVAALRVTAPSPSPLVRSTPGRDACTTSAVLQAGAALHAEHGEGLDDSDRLAADVLLAAARCRSVDDIDTSELFEVFLLARHGLAWVAEHEHGDLALDHALDLWELAVDQQQAGPLVNVAVWNAVSTFARDAAERHLYDASDSAQREAARRLAAIAAAPLDWAEVRIRDERSTWVVFDALLTRPSTWPELLVMPRLLWQARQGTHVLEAEVRRDRRTAQVEAAVLAGAAELAFGHRALGRCPTELDTMSTLEGAGLDLTFEPRHCVVVDLNDGEVRVASPLSAIVEELRLGR